MSAGTKDGLWWQGKLCRRPPSVLTAEGGRKGRRRPLPAKPWSEEISGTSSNCRTATRRHLCNPVGERYASAQRSRDSGWGAGAGRVVGTPVPETRWKRSGTVGPPCQVVLTVCGLCLLPVVRTPQPTATRAGTLGGPSSCPQGPATPLPEVPFRGRDRPAGIWGLGQSSSKILGQAGRIKAWLHLLSRITSDTQTPPSLGMFLWKTGYRVEPGTPPWPRGLVATNSSSRPQAAADARVPARGLASAGGWPTPCPGAQQPLPCRDPLSSRQHPFPLQVPSRGSHIPRPTLTLSTLRTLLSSEATWP